MKSKKSQLFNISLVIITIVVLTTALIFLTKKNEPFEKEPLGKKQAELISVYQKAEKTLFYIDQSAKYAAYQALYDLAENGGFKQKKCGKYLNYNLWNNENNNLEECFPDYKTNLVSFINLEPYLTIYPETKIPLNNYEFSLINKKAGSSNKLEIIGVALKNLEFDIISNGKIVIRRPL